MQGVFGPLIEKLNITDLTTSQAIAMEGDSGIHLTKYLQGHLNGPEHQYKDFVEELKINMSFL
jgi:hypothetical protein